MCAVCDQPVGIDLQKIPEDPERALKIASHFFSREELESLQTQERRRDPQSLCHLFCRYWAARESYIKLTGRGLAEPFTDYRPDLGSGRILLTGSSAHNESDCCYITECSAPEGFCLTACCREPLHSVKSEQYSFTFI